MVLYVIVVPSLSRYNKCATNPYRKKVKEVSIQGFFTKLSDNALSGAKKKSLKQYLIDNWIAIVALILSVISLFLQVTQ